MGWHDSLPGLTIPIPKRVTFCIPTLTRPRQATLDSVRASIPFVEAAGWEHGLVYEIGCPYISAARAQMLRKALDDKATAIVFLDSDVSWDPPDLATLLETDGDVVAGTYRFKQNVEEYMGHFPDDGIRVRKDGCIRMRHVPAGFLKVTRRAVNIFMEAYPELAYGEQCHPHIDLFNHGAYKRAWFGEDFAFSRNWTSAGGEIWLIPNLNLNHHGEDVEYMGNFHNFMLRQPGGSESENPIPLVDRIKSPREVAK
jgi:hypothetical protein